MDGFLNLNKPLGITSHDCVARVRKLLRLKRIGHGGTLDPAATGVLPMAIGRATRLLQFLAPDKAYNATIRFGVRTATDDLEGEILAADPVPQLERAAVMAILPKFHGMIQQIPPRYSAIQVQGKRLYELARAGAEVEVPVRTVEVFSVEVLHWRPGDFPELDVAIACGPGTYIRAIARDMGEFLHTGATLAALVRTRSSGFDLTQSLTLDAVAEQVAAGNFQAIAPDQGVSHLPLMTLSEEASRRLCQGQRLVVPPPPSPALFWRIYSSDQRFLGIAELTPTSDGLLLKPQVILEPM